jgi:hypothetical protein
MKIEAAKIIHGLMPMENEEDNSTDGPRWRGVLARAAYHQVIINQLIERQSAKLINHLIAYYYDDYCLDPRYAELDPPTRDHIAGDHFWRDPEMKAYLALVPKLGDAPDAEGFDRLVQQMIDAAAAEGGPILREGNNLLSGSAGPRFGADSTPTSRIVHLVLYHADRNRELLPAEAQNLYERTDYPRTDDYRTVGWLHERVGGSLPTLYDALRSLAAKDITESIQTKSGQRVRLRVPYTFQAAEDRALWCHLRDEGLLPITKQTVVPGEEPRVPSKALAMREIVAVADSAWWQPEQDGGAA